MTLTTAYALGRVAFGAAVLLAPAVSGRMLAGPEGGTPEAQSFLRGMGGREIGLGAGILTAERTGQRMRPWLIAGVLADAGDIAGIGAAWSALPPEKRAPGIAFAGAAAATGLALLATSDD